MHRSWHLKESLQEATGERSAQLQQESWHFGDANHGMTNKNSSDSEVEPATFRKLHNPQ